MKNPNILIIYVDQLSRMMLSCYGCKEIHTPHIDALAQEGMMMNHFYTPSAVCTPSRGCFMTGNYPFVNGAYRNGMPIKADQKGFANHLKNAGYATGYVGKWHLGEYIDGAGNLENCNHLGFEDWEHQIEFGHCKNVVEKDGKITIGKEIGDETSYTTDWLANKTIQYICDRDRNKPFLFMTSIPDPHQPYKVRAPYNDMFDPQDMLIPISFHEKTLPDWAENDRWGRNIYFPIDRPQREEKFREIKANYLGEIKCIDDNVGRIVKELKRQGIFEETMIVFTTDHGDYMGEHGLLEKNNLYDSVYRLPLIIKGVGMSPQGKVIDQFMSVTDFPKTLMTLAEVESERFSCDGVDNSAIFLADDTESLEEIYIHPSDVPRAGIITREYELAYVAKGYEMDRVFHQHILFDRLKDEHQLVNLYDHPDYIQTIDVLTAKIREHHKKLGTPCEYLPKEVQYE